METNDKEIKDMDDFEMYLRTRVAMKGAVPDGATFGHVMRAAMALISECLAQSHMSEEDEEEAFKNITENIRNLTALHKEQRAPKPAASA